MKTHHTPGPWGCFYTSNHAHDYRLTKANGSPLPLVVEAGDHTEQRSNARLIAAAPDLLQALERMLDYADAGDIDALLGHGFDEAQATVNKAKGAL